MNNLFIGSEHLNLGEKLGSGGEGEVFKIADHPNLAVKLYNETIRLNREPKVRQMIKMIPIKDRNSCVIFPLDIVTSNNRFIGFTMEVVNGYKPIHLLFNPKSRSYEFPYADYRFILRVAKNVALALAEVHQIGCIVGDINQSGILISGKDATVKLIDTDSFQFTSNGRLFPCEVGMEDYTPPELQGQSLKGTKRTVNHDNFGLAVIIFQLLFMGMHPYAGRCCKKDLTMGEAIKENRFAYSLIRSNETETIPAKNALTLDLFPEYIRQAFENAFGTNYNDRPDAKQWKSILTQFEKDLTQCKNSRSHFFYKASSNCVWCSYVKKIHFDFFPNIPLSGPIHILKDVFIDKDTILGYFSNYFDIEKIKLSEIFKLCFERVSGLTLDKIEKKVEKKISELNSTNFTEAKALERKLLTKYETLKNESIRSHYIIYFFSFCIEAVGVCVFYNFKIKELGLFFIFMIFMMILAGFYIFEHSNELKRINIQYQNNINTIPQQKNNFINKEKDSYIKNLKSQYEDNKNRFTIMYEGCISDLYATKVSKLISIKSEILASISELKSIDIDKENNIELERQMQKKKYREKLENAYLSKFNIKNASITSIGPQRKYVLNANGIFTAADISRKAILSIDGFGEYLTDNLVSWRQNLLKNKFIMSYSNFKEDSLQIERIKSNYNQKKKNISDEIKTKFKNLLLILENTRLSFLLERFIQKRKELFKLYADIIEKEFELKLLNVEFNPLNLKYKDSFFKDTQPSMVKK